MEKALPAVAADDDDDTLSFDCLVQQGDRPQRSPDRRRLPTDPDFEFRRPTLPTPTPADLFFSNGLLQPHTFPLNSSTRESSNSTSRSSSTTSSNGSSDGRGRRQSSERAAAEASRPVPKRTPIQVSHAGLGWQRVYVAGPSLAWSSSRRGSRRLRTGGSPPEARRSSRKDERGRGFLRTWLLPCQECRAMEPSKHVVNAVEKV